MTLQRKSVTKLSKGLITEASELTFPEGASVDELNCTLERDGSRRKRLGVSFERDNSFDLTPKAKITSINIWSNVNNDPGKTHLVVQEDNILKFYDVVPNSPLSSNLLSFTVDLSNYLAPTKTEVTAEVDTTSINGALVVVEEDINPLLVKYDGTNYSVSVIQIKVRDFTWLGDKQTYYNKEANPSVQRKYDTLNAGWHGTSGTSALNKYITGRTAWPPLTLPWFAGKDSNGNFTPAEWEKVHAGTTLIVNGHFILNLWSKNRSSVSGLNDTTLDTEEHGRFSCVTNFAGRVFYSGINGSTDNNGSKIFFSRVLLSDLTDIGNCYQQNDPTAEDFSDLLDTDGGFIHISDARNIRKLLVMGPYLLVFADNGVWRVSGVDDVFRASDFIVSKISNTGIDSPSSLVESDTRPYWWSKYGIHSIEVSETGDLREVNISLNSIQTFWLDIQNKKKVKGAYDAVNKKAYWLYPLDNEVDDTKRNGVLIFDENLVAFTVWKISDAKDIKTPVVQDFIFVRESGILSAQDAVTTLGNTEVTDSSGQSLIVEDQTLLKFKPELYLLTYTEQGYTFSTFTSLDFLDWGSGDYEAYLETGYDFQGDMSTKKSIMYLVSYFKRTERGWVLDSSGRYTLLGPSSCYVSAQFDTSTKETEKQQAYTNKEVLFPPNLSLSSTTTKSRLRIRGRGNNLRLRWEGESGKDFHLLGYEVIVNKKDSL